MYYTRTGLTCHLALEWNKTIHGLYRVCTMCNTVCDGVHALLYNIVMESSFRVTAREFNPDHAIFNFWLASNSLNILNTSAVHAVRESFGSWLLTNTSSYYSSVECTIRVLLVQSCTSLSLIRNKCLYFMVYAVRGSRVNRSKAVWTSTNIIYE